MEPIRTHPVGRDSHLHRRLEADNPADIVRLVCSYTAAGLHQLEDGGPGAHVGVSYERVDDAQVGYAQSDETQIDVTELPESTKRSLRNRFGANVTSIGVFR